MKVNILEARSRLSRLVKEALAGKVVIIAISGEPMVRLVPIARKRGLGAWGKLKKHAAGVDAAFTPEFEADVARRLQQRS